MLSNSKSPFPFAFMVISMCWTALAVAVAQPASQYLVEHYSDENGLPQNSVNAIAPDAKGFLWLATEAGLVRFDGKSFFVYDKTLLHTAGNRIRYFLARTGKPGLAEPVFYSCDGMDTFLGVYADSYPRVATQKYPWKKTMQALTRTYTAQAHYLSSLPNIFGPFDVDTLKSPDLGLLAIGENRYFLRKNGMIEYYEKGSKVFGVYFPRNRNIFYSSGKLFAAQADGSLYRIDKTGGHNVELTGDILVNQSWRAPGAKVTYYWNNISQQAFVHLDGHLYELRPEGPRVRTVFLTSGMDLDRRGVVSVYMDSFRNVFLGCRTDGLYILRKKQFNVLTTPADSAGNVYYSLIAAGANRLLTRQGYLFDLGVGAPVAGQAPWKLGHYWLPYFLAKDKSGHLWTVESTSPVDRRVAKYSEDGNRFLAGWDLPGVVEGIYCDPAGLTWIMTDMGILYYVHSSDSGKNRPVMFCDIKLASVASFYRSGRNQLWVGNPDGLHVLDLRTRKVTALKALSGKYVRNIYGAADQLWICTYGDGLYLLKGQKLTHFPLDQDKYMSSVHCIVPDSLGGFWVPTNKGLFQINKADLLSYAEGKSKSVFYKYFDKNSGLNTNEFNGGCQPCGVALKSGNIALPSFNGIVYFNPRNLGAERPDKGILIEAATVDGKPVDFGKAVTVRRDFKQLRVQVTTPYFGNSKDVGFSYRISEDNDRDFWIPLGNERRIYLTGLLPGTHTLQIRKANGSGINNFSYHTLPIIVPPYWYETNWFAALLFVLAGILIYFFLRAKAKYTREQNYQQNLLSNARLYGDIITSINHDIQTPMQYVIYAFEQLTIQLASQQVSPIYHRMGNEGLASLRRISTLTGNLLHYLKVNLYQHNHSIATTSLELSPLVSEIIEMFSAQIARDQIQVVDKIPKAAEYQLNPQIFSVILHNLIDNAVKVSYNGIITLGVEQDQSGHRFMIADTGPGIPQEIADWLVTSEEPFTKGNANQNERRTSYTGGLGLVIVKDLCKLSGIGLAVSPVEGAGTRIFLTLNPAGKRGHISG